MRAETARDSIDGNVTFQVTVSDGGPAEPMAGTPLPSMPDFSVMTATSGDDALRCLADDNIGFVLCGDTMPDLGGLSLLHCARAQMQSSPFIISTDCGGTGQLIGFPEQASHGDLLTPLCFDRLRSTITGVLARFRHDHGLAGYAQSLTYHGDCDPLTGLMSKHAFLRRLYEHLSNGDATGECGVVVLLKIRGLSHINHSYGCAAGDRVLHFAADALRRTLRAGDLIGRIGGDLFSLYLVGAAHAQAEAAALSIVDEVETGRLVLGDDPFSLALVAGGACAYGAMDVDELLNRADFALHQARERGRGRVRFYRAADQAHKHELSLQLNMLALVRAALSDPARLKMHYQPIVDLASGRICHFEALLRVQDDKGKPCPAGELVKTCERFGLIGALDRAVVRTCLAGIDRLPHDTGVAINLSGKSIGDPDLLQLIEDEIGMHGVDPSRIIFELTETAAFDNIDEVRHFMCRIKRLGCRFALDDFGVGFSSFVYIREFAFDYLKLDGSFIVNLRARRNEQVFVRAMVEISRVFGLSVIAEWVEDRETADLLHDFGVQFAQGYHFGAAQRLPIPAT